MDNWIMKDFINKHSREFDNHVKYILHKHYPDVDLTDREELRRLVDSEGLLIQHGEPKMTFENNTVKVEQEVKVYKELR